MPDLVITGAEVIDGTGAPRAPGTLVIDGDRITSVLAPEAEVPAGTHIAADGMVIAPGFIDPHQHSDCSPMVTPWMDSFLQQGVTTAISGNCGLCAWPGSVAAEALAGVGVTAEDVPVTWTTASDYLDALDAARPAINVATLSGHGSFRQAVMGRDPSVPTPAQLAEMCSLVEAAMEAGALGLSTGLIYAPGFHAQTPELIAMASVMAGSGAPYVSHMRNEGTYVFEAIEEAMQIGAQAGVPVHISHLKLDQPAAWGQVDALFDAMAGGDVTCDQYPYAAWETTLEAFLPPWAPVGDLDELLAQDRQRLRTAVLEGDGPWQSSVKDVGWDLVAIGAHAEAGYTGRSIQAIAVDLGMDDPFDAFCRVLAEDPMCGVVGHTMAQEDVDAIRRHPDVMVGSDGIATNPESPIGRFQVHPRYYGTYPRVLARAVREQRLLSLEAAVAAMTLRVAERFQIPSRGRIAPGWVADLVVFDPATVADTATFERPHRYPVGIDAVVVSGELAWSRKGGNGARAGKVLRRA